MKDFQTNVRGLVFGNSTLGGRLFFKATAIFQYGPEVNSNILEGDLPNESLSVESLEVRKVWGDTVIITTGYSGLGQTTYVKSLAGFGGMYIPFSVSKKGRKFLVRQWLYSVRKALTTDTNGFTAWFRLSLDTTDQNSTHSAAVPLFLPSR